MRGLYWSVGLTLTSKSDKVEAIFAWLPDVNSVDGSSYTFGRDVWEGTIGSSEVVNTSEAIGFQSDTPLIAWNI